MGVEVLDPPVSYELLTVQNLNLLLPTLRSDHRDLSRRTGHLDHVVSLGPVSNTPTEPGVTPGSFIPYDRRG